MILTCDIGNTTVALSGVERDGTDYRVLFTVKAESGADLTVAEWQRRLWAQLREADVRWTQPEGSILSSVVPALTETLAQALTGMTGTAPRRVSWSAVPGLTYAIPHPEKLGQDRIADAAWAVRRYPLPVLTVDLGSATTCNVIGRGGVFLGGMISPGIATGLQMLSTRTAQLPAVDLDRETRLIGKDTEECLLSGATYGVAAMVDGLAERVSEALGTPVTVVLTGGLARYVEPLCRCKHTYDPDHLTKGLAYLYDAVKTDRPL